MQFEDVRRRIITICRLYVVGKQLSTGNPPRAVGDEFEIVELTSEDKESIDEITRLDEWEIPKNDTVKDLEEGRLCYAIKYQGRIVGTSWVTIGNTYNERYLLKRELHLADHEAFFGRGWTTPTFRGKGIFPTLKSYEDADVARRHGKTFAIGWVRQSNRPMIRCLGKLGYSVIGRLGFIQVLNIRFHYLWGKGILRETKRRCYFQKV